MFFGGSTPMFTGSTPICSGSSPFFGGSTPNLAHPSGSTAWSSGVVALSQSSVPWQTAVEKTVIKHGGRNPPNDGYNYGSPKDITDQAWL